MSEKVSKKAVFVWDITKENVADAIAKGDRSVKDILTEFKITERVYYKWKKHPDFQRRIDEIIQDIDIAQKSERIKIAKKVIRQKLEQDAKNPSKKDILDWLKYVGEEIGDYEPKQQIKVSGSCEISADPEVLKAANELARKLSHASAVRTESK